MLAPQLLTAEGEGRNKQQNIIIYTCVASDNFPITASLAWVEPGQEG